MLMPMECVGWLPSTVVIQLGLHGIGRRLNGREPEDAQDHLLALGSCRTLVTPVPTPSSPRLSPNSD